TISAFSIDPVPLSAAVLLDTGLTAPTYQKIQNTVPALIGAFSEFDEIAVYRFDTYVARLCDFTPDKTTVESAMMFIRNIKPLNPPVGGFPFSSIAPVISGPLINGVPVAPSNTNIGPKLPKYSKVLHDAIFAAAGDLAKRPPERRRIVIVVSNGI